jgi:hypothetical protein
MRELVAEGFVRFREGVSRDGVVLGQFFAHADGLGSLAGEKECDQGHKS